MVVPGCYSRTVTIEPIPYHHIIACRKPEASSILSAVPSRYPGTPFRLINIFTSPGELDAEMDFIWSATCNSGRQQLGSCWNDDPAYKELYRACSETLHTRSIKRALWHYRWNCGRCELGYWAMGVTPYLFTAKLYAIGSKPGSILTFTMVESVVYA